MDFTKFLETPTYELIIPSTQKKVTFRPFLEKERAILLMALESSDDKEMIRVTKALISLCCLTNDLDIESLTKFDVEYFFIQLRARSIGEIMTLHYKCQHIDPHLMKPCDFVFPVDVDLTTVEVEGLQINNTIKLSNKIQIKMKYPTLVSEVLDISYGHIVACVDTIYTSEGVYTSKEYTIEDVVYLIGHLNIQQMKMLEDFVSQLPTVKKVLHHVCPKCQHKHEIVIEGFESFFV